MSLLRRYILLTGVVACVAVGSAYAARRYTLAQTGAPHTPVRLIMAERQAETAPDGVIVLVGDSIAEMSWMPSLCGRTVLNAAIGGTGVLEAAQAIALVKAHVRPAAVIIAVGVNDASRERSFDAVAWRDTLQRAVAAAAPAKVLLVEPLPVEASKPLGTAQFNVGRLGEIRRMVRAARLPFIPAPAAVATYDGVHPTTAERQAWVRRLAPLCTMLAR